jgi:hypothetical protein
VQALHAAGLLAPRGEHENGRGGALPHLAQDVDAAQARQHPIEDDQIGALSRVEIEGGAAAGGAQHAIAVRLQRAGDNLRQFACIFY